MLGNNISDVPLPALLFIEKRVTMFVPDLKVRERSYLICIGQAARGRVWVFVEVSDIVVINITIR